MRRSAPAPAFRVDPAPVPRWARPDRGPRGVGLTAATPPPGVAIADDGPVWRPAFGAPVAASEAVVVAGGQLALVASPGVARSLRCPQMAQVHDRRPPGLMRVAGASLANAGLLDGDGGWRAVVLPSLGDIAGDLGPGPVAARPDGRRVAVARDDEVVEIDLPSGEPAARHAGAPGALAYLADGTLVVARGAAVGGPGVEATDGSPVVALAAAADALVVLARHADGTCSLWPVNAASPTATWMPPIAGPASIGLGPDGAYATVGTPFAEPAAAAVVEAATGRVVLGVEGARAVALSPAGDLGLVVGGDWGVMWLEPVTEEDDQ